MFYPHYTPEDKPTEEQIQQHIYDFMRQTWLIEDIFNFEKDNKGFNREQDFWQDKSNEDLETIRQTYLVAKQ